MIDDSSAWAIGPHGQPDDDSIANDAALWRRIKPLWIVEDENTGGLRLSSAAFQNQVDQECLSVFLGDDILARGDQADCVLDGHEGYSRASIKAALARDCKQGVVRKPTDVEEAHALVFGPKPKGVKKRLAQGATWIVGPQSP